MAPSRESWMHVLKFLVRALDIHDYKVSHVCSVMSHTGSKFIGSEMQVVIEQCHLQNGTKSDQHHGNVYQPKLLS